MSKVNKKKISALTTVCYLSTILGGLPVSASEENPLLSKVDANDALSNSENSSKDSQVSYIVGENLNGERHIEFDVIPNKSNINGVIGYSSLASSISGVNDLGMQIRLNEEGFFDVLNNSEYMHQNKVYYEGNEKYSIKLDVDFKAQNYDVYVKPPKIQEESKEILVNDDCSNFDELFEKSSWVLESGRFKRGGTDAVSQHIVYNVENINDFDVKVLYQFGERGNKASILERVKFFVSKDNVEYVPIEANIKEGTHNEKYSWNLDSSAQLVPATELPNEMNYLKVVVTEADVVGWSSQIDDVILNGTKSENVEPEEPKYVQIADDYEFSAVSDRLTDIGKIQLWSNEDNDFTVENHYVELYESINPTDDSYVQAGDTIHRNFGSDKGIVVRMPSQRRGFLKFDLSQLTNDTNHLYELRLFADESTHTKGNVASIYGLEDNSWSESTITFDNAPDKDINYKQVEAIDKKAMTKKNEYYVFDVTSYMNEEIKEKAESSLVITGDEWEWTNFNSKENAANHPELRAYYNAKDSLGVLVNKADELYNEAEEGVSAGQYEPGSKENFKKYIDNAKETMNNANSSQSETLVQMSKLRVAINDFLLSKVDLKVKDINVTLNKYFLMTKENANVSSIVLTLSDDSEVVMNTRLTPEINQSIKYESTDSSILEINQRGDITAKDFGKASVKVLVEYGKSSVSIEVPVEVKRASAEDLSRYSDLEGVTSDDERYDIYLDVNRDGIIDSKDVEIVGKEVEKLDKIDALDTNVTFILGQQNAQVGKEIKVISDDKNVVPTIVDGVKMVPMTFAAESFGAKPIKAIGNYKYDYNGTIIKVKNNDDKVHIGNKTIRMSAKAKEINGVLMIPIEGITEAFTKKCYTDNTGIIIFTEVEYDKVKDSKYISELIFNISGENYWGYNNENDYIDVEAAKKELVFSEITADMVKLEFEKVIGEEVHPRTITSELGLNRVLDLYKSGDKYIVGSIDALKKKADSHLNQPDPVFHTDGLRYTTLHEPTYRIADLAFAYALTGDEKYFNKALSDTKTICAYKDWNIAGHALDTGVAVANIATFYDLAYNTLSEADRKLIEDALIKHGLKAAHPYLKNKAWWSVDANNWTGVVNGGLIIGALVLFEKDPQLMSEVIAMSLNGMSEKYIRSFEPAGQNEEGIMYWGYGLMNATMAFESLDNVLGTDFGYSDTNGLRKTGYFPIYTSGPATGLSIGDDPLKSGRSTTKMWLAHRYNDAAIAREAYSINGNEDFREFMFYEPELVEQGLNSQEAQAPLDNFMPGTDLIGFRSTWNHDKATYVGIHGGNNGASHGHLDAGAFDVQANGKVWVSGGLGRDDYNAPGYFENNSLPAYESDNKTVQENAGRWHFYRMRAEGKSALVIKEDGTPDIRPDQNPNGVSVVEKIESKPKGALTILDLTDTYSRDVKSYKRGMMLSEDRGVITIQDEVETKSGSAKVYWLANIKPEKIEISEDGRTAVMTIGNEKMWVGIASPAEGKFKVMDAKYLPGEEFPKTTNAKEVHQKLVIELDNVDKATISVNFIPLNSWENEPQKTIPEVIEMSKWEIADGSMPAEKVEPILTGLKINGVTPDNFTSDNKYYEFNTTVDDEGFPSIETNSEANVELVKTENKVMILLTDKNDETNKNAYYVTINRIGKPAVAEKLDVLGVESSESNDGDPNNRKPENTIDGDFSTRWSADGKGHYLQYDLGDVKSVNYLSMSCMNGHKRKLYFKVQTSVDGESWTEVYDGQSSGTTESLEYYKLVPTEARYVKLILNGNSLNGWNSITEVELFQK